jgi:hypothetical protein
MSEIKVNKISPRTACGTTTLGDSGDTFTIPAGVSITNSGTASGFGATGSASWNTTVKTSDFTAVAGEGYFVDTTSGEVDVALPAGTAGAVIAVSDYANTADTNNIILKQNGSDKIEGSTDDYTVNVEGAAITLVFVDSTKGWITTDTGNSTDASASEFICATGGTITNTPTCRIHTFTGPGSFVVNRVSETAPQRNDISYLVVAGGGSGGARNPGNGNGGGGGGGFRELKSSLTPYTASPLCGSSVITIAAGTTPVTVGGGGSAVTQQGTPELQGNDGSASILATVTSAGGGGGGGGGNNVPLTNGRPGGSGGGTGGGIPSGVSGGTGNTPPVSPAQGFNGGVGGCHPGGNGGAGGGGGATEIGQNQASAPTSGRGGAGATTNISNSPVGYSGGGGGSGGGSLSAGAGSPCGSGAAGGTTPSGSDAAVNRGGGGGGGGVAGGAVGVSGAGGSGVVIIRYKIA